jgi:hypothetical protein
VAKSDVPIEAGAIDRYPMVINGTINGDLSTMNGDLSKINGDLMI